MALSETSQIALAQILGVRLLDVQAQINLMGSRITATVQTAIEAEIAAWDAGPGSNFTKLHPTESNKGVETMPSAVKADIQKNIAVLLERDDWGGGSGGGITSHIMRG